MCISMCLCRLHGLAFIHSTSMWGFALSRIVFPLHISRLARKASGVSLAQLHPPLVARFTLEVTGVES